MAQSIEKKMSKNYDSPKPLYQTLINYNFNIGFLFYGVYVIGSFTESDYGSSDTLLLSWMERACWYTVFLRLAILLPTTFLWTQLYDFEVYVYQNYNFSPYRPIRFAIYISCLYAPISGVLLYLEERNNVTKESIRWSYLVLLIFWSYHCVLIQINCVKCIY